MTEPPFFETGTMDEIRDTVNNEIVPRAAKRARKANGKKRKWRRSIIGIIIALLLATAFIWIETQIAHTRDVISAKDHAQAVATSQASVAAKGQGLAAAINTVCEKGGPDAKAIKPLCESASVIATSTPEPLATGPPGPPPSDSQILAAVNAYFIANPPAIPEPNIDYNTVRTFVNNYLASHPAPSGSPGSSGASGTNGVNGQQGEPGNPGQNATDEQVANAVSAYMAEHPASSGPPGQQGQPPTSWVFTYTDTLGMQHSETCTRDTTFDENAPTYTCSE
jgi:hypothetical protein